MNQLVLFALLVICGVAVNINYVDSGPLPSIFTDTGYSLNVETKLEVTKMQLKVVLTSEDEATICLAIGSATGDLKVVSLAYSARNALFEETETVSLGTPSLYKTWSFIDRGISRGTPDCKSIAFVTDANNLVVGPSFDVETAIVLDGPVNMITAATRTGAVSGSIMLLLGNSSLVRTPDNAYAESPGDGNHIDSLSMANFGQGSIAIAVGLRGADNTTKKGLIYTQENSSAFSNVDTNNLARNPAVAGWPNAGLFSVCFDNAGDLLSAKLYCKSQSGAENVIDDHVANATFSKVTVSPVLDTHGIVSALATNGKPHFRLYAIDSTSSALIPNSVWIGNSTDVFTHDSNSGLIAIAALSGFTINVRLLNFDPSAVPPTSSQPGSVPASLVPTTSSPGEEPPKAPVPPPDGVPQEVQIGVGVSLSVGGAAAGLLVLLLLLKKKRDKKKKGDKGDKAPMTEMETNGNAYTNIPASEQGKYSNISMSDGKYANLDATSGADDGIAVPTSIEPSEIDKRMHIPYKSLVFVKEIGAGSYGKVYLGEWRGAKVAIKVNNTVTDVDGFLAEAKLTLGITPHPNLVQTFGVSLDGPNPCIVLEYCGGGSLDQLFKSEKGLTNAQRMEYALKIGYGLLHLHSRSIVHRDLAARNILLTNDGQPKISDFGMSRIVQEEAAKGRTKTNFGPIRWMAPENLKDKTYSLKSDVWSFGIILYEMVVGKEPHEDADQLDIAVKIRDKGVTPEIPEDCDPALRECMQMCWKFNPNDRPTIEEVCDFLRSKSET